MKHLIQRSLIASTFIITSLLASGAMAADINGKITRMTAYAASAGRFVTMSTTSVIPPECNLSISWGKVFSYDEAAAGGKSIMVMGLSAMYNDRNVTLKVTPNGTSGMCKIDEIYVY